MIKEAYVSFEVSKLLKEKGFDGDGGDSECHMFYHEMTDRIMPITEIGLIPDYDDVYFAPTQQMAMKWFREMHNIDIIIFHEKLPNDCYWARIERYPFTEFQQEPEYKSYEEAVEAALKYVLGNLI